MWNFGLTSFISRSSRLTLSRKYCTSNESRSNNIRSFAGGVYGTIGFFFGCKEVVDQDMERKHYGHHGTSLADIIIPPIIVGVFWPMSLLFAIKVD
jgi:hypothetical protein